MKFGMILFGTAVLLTGHSLSASDSAASDQDQEVETSPEVESILTTPSETAYSDSVRCIATARIRGTEVLDERHILFRMSRNQYQLVQFKNRCPTLRHDSTLVYEVTGTKLCEFDRVRAVNGIGLSAMPGPNCLIPGFQTMTVEQVVLLKETLKEQRRNRGGPSLELPEPLPEPQQSQDAPEASVPG